MATVAENDYEAQLERSRLEESLQAESSAQATAGILRAASAKAKKAGASFEAAAKAVATGQYSVWQSIWTFLAPTFGLSLLLIYVPIFSWLAKQTFPEAIAKKLPNPGEDGLLGLVPPPVPAQAKFVTPFYGLVNKIAMFTLAMILTPIILVIIITPFLPLILAYQFGSATLGPLGQIFGRIFAGIAG